MKELILKLHSIGAIKFGTFEIKKGFIAPFQVDFSLAISHPQIAKAVCSLIWEKAKVFSFDLLCGTPLAGACFANYLAWEHDQHLVLRRPDVKESKLQTKIAGTYKTGQRCLLIHDVDLSGNTSLDLIDDLNAEGIEVRDELAFIDLGLGARKKIKARGYVPHSVLSFSDVLQILSDANKIPGNTFKLSSDFLEEQKGKKE